MKSEIQRARRRRRSPPRWRPVVLLAGCGLGALAAPADAQPAEPAGWWLAESPGAGGARFGLGLDFRFDDLDSLLNAAASETVTLRDPQGRSSTRVIPGDPALNNRKFDYEVEVRSWGAQAPIALPQLGIGGRMTLFASLIVEAATTEITFDFRDRTEPELSTSITGRGLSYGAGLETVGSFGREGKWLVGGGYRFRTLPEIDLERAPGFDRILDVRHDEIRLDQDTHLASLRVGRVFADGRLTPYVGARGRWTELEIDDEVRFVAPNGVETDLRTRSRFESDSALVLAGVDARLGARLAGRVEVAFGDGDVGGLLKVVYQQRAKESTFEPWTPESTAASIAGEIDRIQIAFEDESRAIYRLRTGDFEEYLTRASELLTRTERSTLAVLDPRGYAALADWVRDGFAEARASLQSDAVIQAEVPVSNVGRPVVLLAGLNGPGAGPQDTGQDAGIAWLETALRVLSALFSRADRRCLDLRIAFTVEGVDTAVVSVYPRNAPSARTEILANDADGAQILPIGSYSYEVDVGQQGRYRCDARSGGDLRQCPLDLVRNPVQSVRCRLVGVEAGLRICIYGARYDHCAGHH